MRKFWKENKRFMGTVLIAVVPTLLIIIYMPNKGTIFSNEDSQRLNELTDIMLMKPLERQYEFCLWYVNYKKATTEGDWAVNAVCRKVMLNYAYSKFGE